MSRAIAIETVPQAAAEIIRLHRVFDAQAVDYTDTYVHERFSAVETGPTWRWIDRHARFGSPIFDKAIRRDEKLLVGSGFVWNIGLISPYWLARQEELPGAIIVHETSFSGRGQEYVASPDGQVFEVGYTMTRPGIVALSGGGMTYSYPRAYNDRSQLRGLTGVTPDLLRVITGVQSYK